MKTLPNPAQMAKMQKKIGKKVSEEIEVREKKVKEEELKNLIFIRNTINRIQEKYPNRGACFCLWKGFVYVNKHNKAKAQTDIQPATVIGACDLIEKKFDKRFFLMKESEYDDAQEVINWLVERYPIIRRSIVAPSRKDLDSRSKLESFMALGHVFEEFSKKFPGKSMADFRDYVHVIDHMIISSLNKAPVG